MTYWTTKRWIALAVHIALAVGLLAWAISSSLHFWMFAFATPIYAFGAVSFLDGLALLGFALHLARIPSPLVHARHLLPLASALPLGYDMHLQFLHLGGALTWVFTISITALLVALSFIVWRTIEKLCIDPVDAAREHAEARMQALVTTSEQLQVMQGVADGFVQRHQRRAFDAVHALQPVETYARPAAFAEPMLHVTMHDALEPMHDTQQGWTCVKCGEANVAPIGKDAVACRKASGRYGCPQCKEAK